MIIKIKDFSDIDFTEINPETDEFHMDSGEKYCFSHRVCHVCWDGGTILEELSSRKMICLRCKNQLKEIALPMYDAPDEIEKFNLPEDWGEKELEEWKIFYQEKMEGEKKVREHILKNPEGGEYL